MDHKIFDFPIDGICKLKQCEFEEFKKRLDHITGMSKEEFFKSLHNYKYLMNFDVNNSTIDKINKIINLCIKE